MNLGGIKVSSAEIERSISGIEGLDECAAIATSPPDGGPSQLVVFAVPTPGYVADPSTWQAAMQDAIRTHLNPLFKVSDVVVLQDLPRTASAKVMRRELRARYTAQA